jgi:hypothetical protein
MTQANEQQRITGHTFQIYTEASRLLRSGRWLIGLLVLSGLVVIIFYFGEIESFIQLLRRTAPVWLVVGILLQVGTYCSAAAVWFLAPRRAGISYRILPSGAARQITSVNHWPKPSERSLSHGLQAFQQFSHG